MHTHMLYICACIFLGHSLKYKFPMETELAIYNFQRNIASVLDPAKKSCS